MKQSLKHIYLLLAAIVLIFSLAPGQEAEATCHYYCHSQPLSEKHCGAAGTSTVFGEEISSCILGQDIYYGDYFTQTSYPQFSTNYCSYENTECKQNGCPSGDNETTCTVRKPCWSDIRLCYVSEITGVWDESDGKCVLCSGMDTEEDNFASTNSIKLNCSGGGDEGDGQCESACGADSECDEKWAGGSLPDVCNDLVLKTDRWCAGLVDPIVLPGCSLYEQSKYCESSQCGNVEVCGGNTYTCAYYSNDWVWLEGGTPSGSCCSSADCSCGTGDCVGLKTCTSYQCVGDCSSENNECVISEQPGICTNGECVIREPDIPPPIPENEPVVQNEPATAVEKDSARIRGRVTDDGGESPEVKIYWGLSNEGTSSSDWDHVVNLGVKIQDSTYFKEITGLNPDTSYYYRNYASNSIGSDWADDTAQFTTDPDCDPIWGDWVNLGCELECSGETCAVNEQCQKRVDLTSCLDDEYQCIAHSSCAPVSNICPLNTFGDVTISQNCYIEGEMWLKDGNLTIQDATVEIKPGANYVLEEGFEINLTGANVYLLKAESYSEINKLRPNLVVGEGGTRARPILIDNTGEAAKTNNAVLVILDTKFLIAYKKMRTDCADIRFLDSDNETLLNYWTEPTTCNTTTTKAWVKIPEVPADSTKTIYFYYGDIDAQPMSNAVLAGVVQSREHRTRSTVTSCISGGSGTTFPAIWFDDSSAIRVSSSSGCFTQGKGYAFMTVPKEWIQDKYVRWQWAGIGYPPDPYTGNPTYTTSWRLDIYNGALSRTSLNDFPDRSTSIGATLLQSWTKNAAWIWNAETREGLVDVSSATSDLVTIVFSLYDGNGCKIEGLDLFVHWLEINEKSEGEENIVKLDFSANQGIMIMEQESLGLYNDYGLYRTKTGADITSVRAREIIPTCIRRNPEISLFNANSYGIPGDVKEFNAYITNKDNFACPDSGFDLSNNCPSGWTCSFDQGSVTLPPYETTKVKLTVTSAASASVDDYIISLTATNTSSDKANSAQIDYSVMPLYAWWGDGSDGDVTISANTNVGGTVKYYNNLTINQGIQLYSDQESMNIFVQNNLVLNGDIVLKAAIPGGVGGESTVYGKTISGGAGGNSAGVLTIFARNITGSGKIMANGDPGNNGGSESGRTLLNGENGMGAVCEIYTGTDSTGGSGKKTGGVPGTEITSSSIITQYVNSVNFDTLPILLSGYGGSAGGGGSGCRKGETGCSSTRSQGGGGGGGGSYDNLGGAGGSGVNGTAGGYSGGGGGGGGAGGMIMLVSQDITRAIEIQSLGGTGGTGGNGRYDSDGGGGGGGSGGITVLISDENIGAEFDGGIGGTADEAYIGVDGASGAYTFYDINNFPLNLSPIISNVSATPNPVDKNNTITFNATYSDPDEDSVKIRVCRTNEISRYSQSCVGGAWCSTAGSFCNYYATEADLGTNNYYAFICDDYTCSDSFAGTFSVMGCASGHINNGDGTCTVTLTSVTKQGSIYEDRKSDCSYGYYGRSEVKAGGRDGSSCNSDSSYQGYVEWDTSAVPDAANVINLTWLYSGMDTGSSHIDSVATRVNLQPSSEPEDRDLYYSIGGAYVIEPGFPFVGSHELELGDVAENNFENKLNDNWFAVGLVANEGFENLFRYSRLYLDSHLRVIYTFIE